MQFYLYGDAFPARAAFLWEVAGAEQAISAVFVLVRGVLILAWLSLDGSGVQMRPEGFGLSPLCMLLGVRNCILRVPDVGSSPGGT